MLAYRNTIEKIHRISERMLQSSQQNEWQEVVDIEQERQLLLGQLASIEVREPDPVSENLLQNIITINTEIEALSRQEMDNCRKEYNEVKNKKSAINAYSAF